MTWSRHQMETFSALLSLCAGNSLVTGEFPPTKASYAGLWCCLWSVLWINGWVNNHEVGNLRLHRAHYGVIVMNRFLFTVKWNIKLNDLKGNLIFDYHICDNNAIKWYIHLNISLNLGAVSIRKTVLPGMAIPMLKIRRPNGRLIFNIEIAIRR